jgi:predicted dehydrogenase
MSFRVGIVGSGSMGTTHAHAWTHTPATIAALHSLDRPSLERVAGQTGAPIADSLDALIESVDVVDICTPTHLHHEMIIAAAAKGKHIICEKPISRHLAQAQAAIDACKAAGITLLIAQVVRFFPEYALAQQVVTQGDVGQVGVIRLSRCTGLPYRHDPTSWFHDPALSGGMIVDLMIHDFDYARWIAGEVTSVYARSLSAQHPESGIDHALAILTHKDGAISHIEGSWAYPAGSFRTALEIAGNQGLIEHPADSSTPISLMLHQSETQNASVAIPRSPLDEDPYTTEIKHFYDVLTSVIPQPRVTAQDALEALRIALAAAQSVQTGRAVHIEEVA